MTNPPKMSSRPEPAPARDVAVGSDGAEYANRRNSEFMQSSWKKSAQTQKAQRSAVAA